MSREPGERRSVAPGVPRRVLSPRESGVRIFTPRQIYQHLDRYVIGQTAAKRAVSIAAHQHLKRVERRRLGQRTLLRKGNLLLLGPTGSAKTHLAPNLAALPAAPFTLADAPEYTEAGHYG